MPASLLVCEFKKGKLTHRHDVHLRNCVMFVCFRNERVENGRCILNVMIYYTMARVQQTLNVRDIGKLGPAY